MSARNSIVYIRHILDAIEKIEGYIAGFTYETFITNNLVMDGVARELEIIGEAANNVEREFQDAHPEVPWAKMIGIRNILIHEYFGVNEEIVWKTCRKDIPGLKPLLSHLVV